MSDLLWFMFGAVIGATSIAVVTLSWLDRFLRKYKPVERV